MTFRILSRLSFVAQIASHLSKNIAHGLKLGGVDQLVLYRVQSVMKRSYTTINMYCIYLLPSLNQPKRENCFESHPKERSWLQCQHGEDESKETGCSELDFHFSN